MSGENSNNERVEVKQGRSSGTVRYVLYASMVLIAIAAFVLFFIY